MKLATLGRIPPPRWPRSAGRLLRTTLADARAPLEERARAATLAGQSVVTSDAMVRALLAIVERGGEDVELRGQAALSLGEILAAGEQASPGQRRPVRVTLPRIERIRSVLRALHEDAEAPPLLRQWALTAAVRRPDDWHRAAVAAAWEGDDPEWRSTAVFCMGYVPGFEKQILAALASGDAGLEMQAMRAAAEADVPAAWPHLAEILRSHSRDRRRAITAVIAALSLRPRATRDLLVEIEDRLDDVVADVARRALAVVGEPARTGGDR